MDYLCRIKIFVIFSMKNYRTAQSYHILMPFEAKINELGKIISETENHI